MAKRTGTPAEKAARQEESEARKVLRSLQLAPALDLRPDRSDDGYETWAVLTPAPVPLGNIGLPGYWYLRLSWCFRDAAEADRAEVVTSSMSLNARGLKLMEGGTTECLVRYDLDRGNPVARHNHAHLNIFQPGLLWDRVHYPICGIEIDAWPLRAVLDFFLSEELRNDLANRIEAADP